jgi:probable phosphoglycerate mutase
MIKTEIYLVRHGETEWNLQRRYQGSGDSPLTEKGINQAKALNQFLKEITFDKIYSSPANRALHTAQIITGKPLSEITVVKEFQEINLGKWEGKLYSEMENENPELYYGFWHAPNLFKPIDCESFIDLTNRTLPAFKNVVDQNIGNRILIVSHAAALMSILNKFENHPLEKFWEKMLKQTSLSLVEMVNKDFKIIKYGDITHLKDIL